ncbi:extracellular solute-binding protein [Streptomyces sp. NPDC088553]|uniref:extracellular solute-binding protein n=1 Tax=Streptomyces sp. NPDC088553 TaxID=3365864 RepID=UPI0037FA971D
MSRSSRSTPSRPLDRRTLLRLGAGVGLGAAAAPLITACGGSGAATEKASVKSGSLLPNTVLRDLGITPDHPGTAQGVPQGFTRYPAKPVRSVPGAPLKGARTITASLETFKPPAPGRERNAAWQEIEKRLGTQVDIQAVAADDWPTRFSTMVASDTLTDLFMYPETGGVDHKAAFLAAKCADLTPYLSGDRIKDYPNLAAIPKSAWQGSVYGGKLYGIPIARAGTGGAGYYRHDLFAAAGVTSLDQITDMDRFFELCKELTRPKEKQYAISAGVTTLVAMSYGAPYYWRMDATTGKFTLDLETEEYRAAIEMAAKLYRAGCYYPGTVQMSGAQKAQYTDLFKNGRAAYVFDGWPAYLTPSTGYLDAMAAIDPSYDVRPMTPIGRNAVAWNNNARLSESFVRKADANRVKEILQLANWVAAPFGTEEYTLLAYGVEGTDHRRDGKGAPILTAQGSQDVAVPWQLMASATPALYSATNPRGVEHLHDAYARLIPRMTPDPTASYSSPTWDSKASGTLNTLKGDWIKDIVTGRKPMSSYDGLVKEYLAKGGRQARGEFEEAAQKGAKQ